MTQTAAEVSKAEILKTIESVKASLDGLHDYDPRFREVYQSCVLLTHQTIDIEDEPLVDWLEDFVFDNEWALPQHEPEVIVGRQREATPKGRRKLNVSRSSSMGNPFVLKEHGGDCETAEEATNKYIKWLWPRLRDTTSREYAWFEEQPERLCSGENLLLGCWRHDHCHGVWIAHLLNTGDWRRWDTIDVEDWCARAIELLAKNWQQFDAFDCTVEPSSLAASDFAAVEAKPGRLHDKHAWLITEAEFLDWDNPDPTIKRIYC